MQVRGAAARVVFEVVTHGKSLADILPNALTKFSEPRDQALLQALCYGVCRRFFYLSAVLDNLLDKPMPEKDNDIYALMLVGLLQLSDMRIPAYAAVAETVAATKLFNKIWAKNLVNAVLRSYQRRSEEFPLLLLKNQRAQHDHPLWLIKAVQAAWPQQAASILAANNAHPPLALRVNQQQCQRDAYLKKLSAATIAADLIPETAAGIVLAEPMDVKQLPGFMQGEVSVQDGAAQFAAELLALAPGQRVLDACAAPGGKTAHMAECEPALGELLAIDQDASRLETVKENLQRLKLTATCLVADASKPAQWWDKKPFDRILLDAPCSATGVIRRHPDIKLLRCEDDIAALANIQTQLLTALWPLLKTGGLFLYATCSILPAENAEVLKPFLASHPDARAEKIIANWGVECAVGRQIFPGMNGMDGFYYALLRKWQ